MSVSLKLKFKDADARTVSSTLNHAKPDAEASAVKALMEGMIANKAIYSPEPVAIVGAEFVTVSSTPVSL